MKKYGLIIGTLLFFVFTCRAQVYYPMFGYHHIWYVDHNGLHDAPRAQNDNLSYQIMDANNDTVVGSKTYFKAKLYWDNYLYSFDTTLLFREDTLQQKVWILLNDTGKEKLLYDFSMNKGDSIYLDFDFQDSTIDYYYTKTGWYHVDSVTMIPTLAGQRKALYLSNPHNLYDQTLFAHYPELEWVEQNGSTIMPDYTQHDIDAYAYRWGYVWNFCYVMLCSFYDSTKIYHNTAFDHTSFTFADSDSCQLQHYAGILNINNLDLRISLSPNPAEDVVTINATLMKPSDVKVQVFNTTGIKCYDEQIISVDNNFQSSINIRELPAGMYFVRLSNDDSYGMSRFVKY